VLWRPRVTVAAIAEREGRFLVVEERVGERLVINQPAGHLEEGEDLVEAVRRETLEETGCHFTPQGITGLYLYRAPDAETYLRVCFFGEAASEALHRALDPEIERTAWVAREELAMMRDRLRSPLVLRCIDDYLRGARYPLSLLGNIISTAD
jgi:8-oxo-dGTP pyrophosphatase MutT (NUDIX family)